MASLEQVRRPALFWPRSCLVNLNGLAKNAALFLALSFCLHLWNSALRKVKSCFLRIALRFARPALLTSPTDLYCLFSSLSSSLRHWIFLALWLGWSRLGCLGSKSLSCDVHYESGHRSQSVVHICLSCYFQDLAYIFIKLLPLNSLGGFVSLDPWLDRRGTASCYDCSLLALEALWVVERCCFLGYGCR